MSSIKEGRGPTKEQIREWLGAIRDVPLTVQPSYKQAERRVRYLATGYGFLADEPIVSTVHDRCADCGKIIVQRHNYLVPHDARAETQYDIKYWHYGVSYAKPGTICVGCFNKKREEYRALKDWNETRLKLGNTLHNVKKLQKEQRNEQH